MTNARQLLDKHVPEGTLSTIEYTPIARQRPLTHGSLGNGLVATELTHVYTATDKHGIT
jgi:hypothetical protein